MKKYVLTIILIALMFVGFSQEVISDLPFNPQLYYKYKLSQESKGNRRSLNDTIIFSPDTLPLPFVDDFSKNHLKSDKPLDSLPVGYRIYRSITLTDTIREFHFMTDTTWTYKFDSSFQLDTTIANVIRFILNNDSSDFLRKTDSIIGFAPYNIFDTTGRAVDTVFLSPDSTIQYSIFYAVHDPNALWLDNYVYLNDDYPVNKWSYGVATFDGLNQYGLPFNNNTLEVYGYADTLTSQPINLPGQNSNVILSFLYQPQGLGNRPEVEDSLILEFKYSATQQWKQIWGTAGFDATIDSLKFNYYIILFDTLSELNSYEGKGFQFRFINKASISGNNDHWHLDYVFLGRKLPPYYDNITGNPLINDISVLNPASSFLKNYTSMPWYHFEGFEQSEQVKPIALSFRNNYSLPNPQNTPTKYTAVEVYSADTLFDYNPTANLNLNAFASRSFTTPGPAPGFPERPFTSDSFLPYLPPIADSVLFDIISTTTFNDTANGLTIENNSVSSPVLFKNYFAYDDGTAERAYGLEPQGLLKFAYKFKFNRPDTLRAIQFYFAQVNENLSLLEFTLMVWKNIGIDGRTEDTLYARPATPFVYLPERNGFVTYHLDSPILLDFTNLPDSTFYVGWQQLFSENIQLGLDLNTSTSAKQRMFYYSSGTWKKSNITGFDKYAAMIRPVVGKELPVGTGPVENPAARGEVILYPNPAENAINLVLPPNACRMEIFDLQGRLVKKVSNPAERIDLAGLSNGLYCLRVSSNDKVWVRKFVKR